MNRIAIDRLFNEDPNNQELDFEGFTEKDNVDTHAIQVQVHLVKSELNQSLDGSYDANSEGKRFGNVSYPLSELIRLKNEPNYLNRFEVDVQSCDNLNLCISDPRSVSAEFFENDLEVGSESKRKRRIKPKLCGNDFVSNTDTLIRGMVSKTLATYSNASDDTNSEYSSHGETSISKTSAFKRNYSSLSNDEFNAMFSPNRNRFNSSFLTDSGSPFKGFENYAKRVDDQKPKKRKYNSVIRNLKKNKTDCSTSEYGLDGEQNHLSFNFNHNSDNRNFIQPRIENIFDDLDKEKDLTKFEEFDMPHYMKMESQSPYSKKFGPFKPPRSANKKNSFCKKIGTKKSQNNYNNNDSFASGQRMKRKKTNQRRGKKKGRNQYSKGSVTDYAFKPSNPNTISAKLSQSGQCSTLLSQKPGRKRKPISFHDGSSDDEFLNSEYNLQKSASVDRSKDLMLKKSKSPPKAKVIPEICSDDEDFLPAEVMHLERQLKREQQRVKQKMSEVSAKRELNRTLYDYLVKAKLKLLEKQKTACSLSVATSVDSDLPLRNLEKTTVDSFNVTPNNTNESVIPNEPNHANEPNISNEPVNSNEPDITNEPVNANEPINANEPDKISSESQSHLLNDITSSKGTLQHLRKFRLENIPKFVDVSPEKNMRMNSNSPQRESVKANVLNNKTVISKEERFNSMFRTSTDVREEFISMPKREPTPVHVLCKQIDSFQRQKSRVSNSSILSKLLNKYRAINSSSNLAINYSNNLSMLKNRVSLLNK